MCVWWGLLQHQVGPHRGRCGPHVARAQSETLGVCGGQGVLKCTMGSVYSTVRTIRFMVGNSKAMCSLRDLCVWQMFADSRSRSAGWGPGPETRMTRFVLRPPSEGGCPCDPLCHAHLQGDPAWAGAPGGLWAVRAAFRAYAEDRPLDGGGVRGRAQNNTEGRGLCWA